MTAWVRSLAVAGLACLLLSFATAKADEQLVRGRYLVSIMDCAGCHTPFTPEGMLDMTKALQGGNYGFEIPGLGVFVPPNLTSDQTGLGTWTDEEIIAAITRGIRPDGRLLAPIMPWMSYSALTDEDAAALVAYLRSVPPVEYIAPGPFGSGEPGIPVPYLTMKFPG